MGWISTGAGLVALAALITGCTSQTGGSPSPSPIQSSAASSRLSPPLTAPALDLTTAKGDPCGLLTSAEIAQFNLSPGTPDLNGASGPQCEFQGKTVSDPLIRVGVATANDGLEGIYQRRSNFKFFEPSKIAGYPAVAFLTSPDPGSCGIDVALRENEALAVFFTATPPIPSQYADPCGVTTTVVTSIISRLQG